MSNMRIALLLVALGVSLFVLFSWFGGSSSTRSSTTDKKHHELEELRLKEQEANWKRLEALQDMIEQKLKGEDNVKDTLAQIEETLKRVLSNDDRLIDNWKLSEELDKKAIDNNRKLEKVVNQLNEDREKWATQQKSFLQKIEDVATLAQQALEEIPTKESSGPKKVSDTTPPPKQPSKKMEQDKTDSVQDEIEKLYEEEDKAKETKKNGQDNVPESEHNTKADIEEIPDSALDTPSKSIEEDEEILQNLEKLKPLDGTDSDTDAQQDLICAEDEISELIMKNVPSLVNHEANSRCLFLNGRPSLYCDKAKAKEEKWFHPPNVTAINSIVPPPASEFEGQDWPDPSTIKIVGLASMVRSGNSWLRNLVESASGIITEAAYRREGKVTPWGTARKPKGHSNTATRGVKAGEYAFVKTHHADARYNWSKVVRLLRFPLDIEPWMRFTSNLKKGEDAFSHFKSHFAHEWLTWHGKWNCWSGEQLIVRYEDLMDDTACVLREVLDFLEYDYTDADIDRAVAAFPPSGLTEKEKRTRALGWDVPTEYLDYATQLFGVVIREFGYQDLLNEVISWRSEKGI